MRLEMEAFKLGLRRLLPGTILTRLCGLLRLNTPAPTFPQVITASGTVSSVAVTSDSKDDEVSIVEPG